MRRLLLLIVCAFVGIAAQAEKVTEQEAKQIALQFVPQSLSRQTPGEKASDAPATVVYTYMMPQSNRAAFYIINVGEDAFVLVSADDAAQQVLGYSFSKSFPVKADGSVELPPHIKGFFNDLAAQMKVTVDGGAGRPMAGKRTVSRRAANLPERVDPLITTTWDQGQYYNALCPMDDQGAGGHVWTGCVATSMAQIIKYWEPTHKRGAHYYNSSKYGQLEVDFGASDFDYANMPQALTAASSEAQVNAVAKLMFECGVACNMSYGVVESSTFDTEARAALINYFGFSPDMGFAEKRNFSVEDWNTLLRENLAARHPVMYSGQSGAEGHSFICDGYKADDYFHFNFGWGGAFDGWFLTSAIDPRGANGYNSQQAAIVGIVPDANGHVILGQMTGTSTFTVDEPLEFYNSVGHNVFEDTNYDNSCNSTFIFKSADAAKHVVLDINEIEDQNVSVFDGEGTNSFVRDLRGGTENDMSPLLSTGNALTLKYTGNLYNAGFKLTISQEGECRMVSNIVSAIENTTVHLSWTENGTATQWQVQYGVKGFELGSGTLYNTTSNTVTFEDLQKFTEYDFYIRSVSGNQYGPWNKTTLMVEAPYWQDVVTAKPAGYELDEQTNTVRISTPEALAWWSKTDPYRNVELMADIDLADYKWRPTKGQDFNGNGHVISNGHIIERAEFIGFFTLNFGNIKDLGLDNFYVKGIGGATGILCGDFRGSVHNCYVTNSVVDGGDNTGGLFAICNYASITNCFVNVSSSGARWASLMVGVTYGTDVKNCYAVGRFRQRAYCYNGGIIAYSDGGTVSSCYSVKMPMGVIGYEGGTHFTDTATFVRDAEKFTLLTPIIVDEQPVTDLLEALNTWVAQTNDTAICTWTTDQHAVNGGYPVFGDKHVIVCPNVTDVAIKNINAGDKTIVSVGWKENGNAGKWQIRYRRYGDPESKYAYIETTSNPTTIQDLAMGKVYEFNIRAIGEDGKKSGWCDTEYQIVDLLYWTDVVTEQPAGYSEDAIGNATISSAEGLAWFAAKVNGLNGQEADSYEGRTVTLTADIDLTGYRWNAIGYYNDAVSRPFSGTFDGQNHAISNIYVNDEGTNKGLIGYGRFCRIKNVKMVGGSVAIILGRQSIPISSVGGLVGYAYQCHEISNCHSSVDVYGIQDIGSLCGYIFSVSFDCHITNCSASGQVSGRQSVGGLIGQIYGQTILKNCFATGDVVGVPGNSNAFYRGGLIGHAFYSTVINCYSTGRVSIAEGDCRNLGNVIGCPEDCYLHYLYGRDDINTGYDIIGYDINKDVDNLVTFHHQGSQNTLTSAVTIDGKEYADMNDALNAWVKRQNSPSFKTWSLDGDTGYPVLDADYVPTCFNPSDLVAENATKVGDATVSTSLTWSQEGNPTSWEVLYVALGHDVAEGTIVEVTSNPCVLTDIPVGVPLDFYVRAVNNADDKSYWSEPVTYLHDQLHWTEVVTTQPDGYSVDDKGNVNISSAEGLAWLASVTAGLNGAIRNDFSGKTISILSDIDLSGYRWTPIGLNNAVIYNCTINGNGHTISGLYCNEIANYQGFIGYMVEGSISNLNLSQCKVYGKSYVGGLAGNTRNVAIENCSVSGDLSGIADVGGVVGMHEKRHIVNCSFIGDVKSRYDISEELIVGFLGGLCGSSFNDSIMNCYVVSEVVTEGKYSGIITGTGYYASLLSNCYYKQYNSNLPVTGAATPISNISSFEGSGTAWTLKTPVYVNNAFRTDLLEVLNAWVDANNAEGNYSHWTIDAENQNGGFPVLVKPTFIAVKSCTREYGEANPTFQYEVSGPALDGTPEISCEATATSPVGSYAIVVKQGSLKNVDIVCDNGVLTITKAKLKASVGDYEREEGQENPEFTIVYEGWKNGENERVLTTKATVSTEAVKSSKAGTYPLIVSGGEAQNYEFEYENGTLTVMEVSGIEELLASGIPFDVYTVTGQKVKSQATTLKGLPAGIYIVNGRKTVLKR